MKKNNIYAALIVATLLPAHARAGEAKLAQRSTRREAIERLAGFGIAILGSAMFCDNQTLSTRVVGFAMLATGIGTTLGFTPAEIFNPLQTNGNKAFNYLKTKYNEMRNPTPKLINPTEPTKSTTK